MDKLYTLVGIKLTNYSKSVQRKPIFTKFHFVVISFSGHRIPLSSTNHFYCATKYSTLKMKFEMEYYLCIQLILDMQ
jgi:hypothetical protein